MSERSGLVALVGWTNVGKSTLLNRLVGHKLAAVADVPQTTRNRIRGVLTLPDRGQIVFVDTPGFHRPRHRMNRVMVRAARDTLAGVDVVVLILDAARGIGAGDREIASLLREVGTEPLVALNKVDRVRPKSRLLPMIEAIGRDWGFSEVVPVSALTGDGCAVLVDCLIQRLPEEAHLFPDDDLTDQPERFLVAEWIREKLLHHTRQELPHATAVMVEGWHRRPDGLVEIQATIYVERESQKAIVIGKEGNLLKRVGTEARREIEELLGIQVFLRLWVKVRKDWREDERALRDLGIV